MRRFHGVLLATVVWIGLVEDRPAAAFVDGIDVSRWQGNINWTEVKNSGIQFAFTKATEGVNYVDPEFHDNMQGATSADVLIGPYHFCRIDSLNGVPFTSYDGSPFLPGTDPYIDAVSEADDFLDAILPYYQSGQHLPPVADVEGLPDFNNATLERQFISNWVQLFSDTVDHALGARPLIYTSKYGANTRYEPSVAATHDLWLAWWKDGTTGNPPVASDTPLWNDWKFWQYTATGSVAGISGNVDRDVFDGTMTALEQLLIGTDPGGGGHEVMIADFETDEGYFRWSTSFSGSNQGIGDGSTANRVTTEAYAGIAAQEIFIDGDPSSWLYRHVSGLSSPAADPSTNLALEATGSLGFWLKTDDPGVTVQIAVDDPQTADRGISKDVTADGRWHLYQWDLEDDLQWEAWNNEEGIITGPTVTIDSIQFRGAGDATIYLDSVAHNPNGSLLLNPGDFDDDGDVDGADFLQWQRGQSPDPVSASDLADWEASFGNSPLVATASVPEPSTLLLAALGAVGLCLSPKSL